MSKWRPLCPSLALCPSSSLQAMASRVSDKSTRDGCIASSASYKYSLRLLPTPSCCYLFFYATGSWNNASHYLSMWIFNGWLLAHLVLCNYYAQLFVLNQPPQLICAIVMRTCYVRNIAYWWSVVSNQRVRQGHGIIQHSRPLPPFVLFRLQWLSVELNLSFIIKIVVIKLGVIGNCRYLQFLERKRIFYHSPKFNSSQES